MKPKISILHPSYQRPSLAFSAAKNWIYKADNFKSIEYIMCLFSHDPAVPEYLELFKNLPVHIVYHRVANMVEQVNYAATLSKGNLIVDISDDFDCPEHWDTLLLEVLNDKKDFIVKTQDGIQPYIITLPIMDRAYYERFNFIYHPEYKHMYGDEELADVGKKLGRTITLDITFPHLHYIKGHMKKDAVNARNDLYMAQDKETYLRRKKKGFPV